MIPNIPVSVPAAVVSARASAFVHMWLALRRPPARVTFIVQVGMAAAAMHRRDMPAD